MIRRRAMPHEDVSKRGRSDGRKGWRSVRYTVIIESGRESGYVVVCPDLPGCVSQGRTRRAALKNIKEAMEAYVEALLEDGRPVPVERGREIGEIEVTAR